MNATPPRPDDASPGVAPSSPHAGRIFAAGAVLCLVASGALMWWRHGEEVFSHLVTAALAWCF